MVFERLQTPCDTGPTVRRPGAGPEVGFEGFTDRPFLMPHLSDAQDHPKNSIDPRTQDPEPFVTLELEYLTCRLLTKSRTGSLGHELFRTPSPINPCDPIAPSCLS